MPSVAASVESRLKGNANGPSGGRGQGRGGRGGGRGQGRLNAPLGRVEGEVEDQGGAGDRASRGRQPRGKDLHKRHDNDRRDGTGRGCVKEICMNIPRVCVKSGTFSMLNVICQLQNS